MARNSDPDKRTRILEAAFKTFGEKAFAATTIKDIAERAGVAAGTVYTYFPDKEELFRSTVERGWADFLADFENELSTPGVFMEKLGRIIDVGYRTLEEYHPLLWGMFSDSNLRNLSGRNLERLSEILDDFLEAGRKELGLAPGNERKNRLITLRLFLGGHLMILALTPPDRVKATLADLKENLAVFVQEQIRHGGSL